MVCEGLDILLGNATQRQGNTLFDKKRPHWEGSLIGNKLIHFHLYRFAQELILINKKILMNRNF